MLHASIFRTDCIIIMLHVGLSIWADLNQSDFKRRILSRIELPNVVVSVFQMYLGGRMSGDA